MAKKLKPIPKTPKEISHEMTGHPMDETIRGERISANENEVKDISIGLQDIDNAVLYYFKNVIKPYVIQNQQLIEVPTIYSNGERWKTIQKDGAYRDNKGKMMLPLLTLTRTGFQKQRDLGNKLDGNAAHNVQVFEVKYNKRNIYNRFNVINGNTESRQYVSTAVPDYIDVYYDCILFTEFVEQANDIIESIEFSSDSYWGDMTRYKFRCSIDDFTTSTSLVQGEDRGVKSSFRIKLKGYILPNSINRQLANVKGFFTPKIIKFIENIMGEDSTIPINPPQPPQGATIFEPQFESEFE